MKLPSEIHLYDGTRPGDLDAGRLVEFLRRQGCLVSLSQVLFNTAVYIRIQRFPAAQVVVVCLIRTKHSRVSLNLWALAAYFPRHDRGVCLREVSAFRAA